MKTLFSSNVKPLALLALMPALSWLTQMLDDYWFRILMLVGINIMMAVSLNLINGVTGQFSLGHAGFMAVGGYVSATLTYYVGRAYFGGATGVLPNLLFFGSLVAGALASAILGFLVGLPSLRLKGDYLAIVTLGLGEIIGVVIRNIEAVGGSRGFADIPPYTNFGWVYAGTLISIFGVARLVESAYGRAMLAVREDEVAAEAVGVSTTKFKVLSFTTGAFISGLAGGLFAHYLSYLNPSMFTFIRSFEIVAMVVLGGLGSISGSILAAAGLTVLPELLRPLQKFTSVDLRMVIYSLILIILMLTRPTGLMGKKEFSLLRKAWR